MYNICTVVFVLFHAVLANRLSGGEDDFLPADMDALPSEDRGVGRFVQPDLVNIGTHSVGERERDDIDAGHLEPVRSNMKKPRRTNLQRTKNHKTRHGANAKENTVKSVNVRSITWKPDSEAKGKLIVLNIKS